MKKSVIYTSLVLATLLQAEQIQSIKYTNLSKISQDIADETLNLNVGDNIDNKTINNAIKKFYKFGYFNDITVNNNNGNIEFLFKEKASISNIEVNGYKTREEDIETLKLMMGIKKGSMYTPARVKEAKKSLLKNLERDGYVNSVVEVEIENLNEDSVSLVFNVNKGDEIVIKKVNYYGSSNLDESDFEEVTANNEEDFASWWFGQNSGELKLDQLEYEGLRIRDKYLQHGYLDSMVEDPFLKVNFASNESTLDFFINEGQQYSTNEVTIFVDSTIIDAETLYPNLKLKKEKVFNIAKLRSDVEYIKTQIADLGYAFAQVKYDIKKNSENATTDVVFNVIPGKKVYINDVIISGNGRTLDRVVRRNVFLAPGDLFSLTDFNDSRSRLKRTGFFEDVTIEQKRVSEDRMDLLVNVSEAATGNLILGGGYGSYDGLLINASVKDKNIFGSGLGVGFTIDLSSKKHNYEISLTNPAINDSKYNGSIEIHNTETEIDYSDPGKYQLTRVLNGFSTSIGKELVRNLYAGVKYRLDSIDEKYTDEDLTDAYDPKANGFKSDQDYLLSSLTPFINFNNTDDFYLPRSGIKAGTSLEYAGIGGDSKFIKSLSNFRYYHSLENYIDMDWIFRYKANVKLLIDNGKVTQGDTFYLGGTSSVRGYESYAFGPDDATSDEPYKRMFANSIELSMPLLPKAKMRWGLFYDYGMIGKDSFSEIKRSGAGALIEWTSPVGPIQFIFSQPLDDEQGDKTSSFEFSLGTQF